MRLTWNGREGMIRSMNGKMIALLLAAVTGSGVLYALPQQDDEMQARAQAAEEKRAVMLHFTGTDWCTACIHQKTRIFDSAEFEEALGGSLVLSEVDFPRTPELREKISDEEWERREDMLAAYSLEALPAVVLTDEQGLPFGIIRGTRREAQEYIELVRRALALREARDAAFAAAAELQGMERARALAAVLELLPEECRDKYTAVIAEITELDSENTLGWHGRADVTGRRVRQLHELRKITESYVGRFSREDQDAFIAELDTFMAQPGMVAEARQRALLLQSSCYAMLRDFDNQVRCMKSAIQVAPSTRQGQKAQRDLDFLEKHVLPHIQTP